MRLLLIDDEVRKAQALLNYFLFVREWDAKMASGPDEALGLLGAKELSPFDVIILDIMMAPGVALSRESTNSGRDTGLVLLDAITKLLGGRRVPIVVYSARTGLDHLKTDRRVAAYIQKPRSAREIAREIDSLVSEMAS